MGVGVGESEVGAQDVLPMEKVECNHVAGMEVSDVGQHSSMSAGVVVAEETLDTRSYFGDARERASGIRRRYIHCAGISGTNCRSKVLEGNAAVVGTELGVRGNVCSLQ